MSHVTTLFSIDTKIIVTKTGTELIIGLNSSKKFKLVALSDACIQREVKIDAVHITDEAETNYEQLKKKWNKHLPLGKVTGDPLED